MPHLSSDMIHSRQLTTRTSNKKKGSKQQGSQAPCCDGMLVQHLVAVMS